MQIRWQWFLVVWLTLVSSLAFSANKVVHYGSQVVQLEGVIEIHTFPGPPNYESIKKGDTPEKGFYLKLKKPINVTVDPTSKNANDFDEPEKNVTLIQLAVSDEVDLKKLKPGKHVRLEGTLFHAHTGHHHSPVLMDVKRVQ